MGNFIQSKQASVPQQPGYGALTFQNDEVQYTDGDSGEVHNLVSQEAANDFFIVSNLPSADFASLGEAINAIPNFNNQTILVLSDIVEPALTANIYANKTANVIILPGLEVSGELAINVAGENAVLKISGGGIFGGVINEVVIMSDTNGKIALDNITIKGQIGAIGEFTANNVTGISEASASLAPGLSIEGTNLFQLFNTIFVQTGTPLAIGCQLQQVDIPYIAGSYIKDCKLSGFIALNSTSTYILDMTGTDLIGSMVATLDGGNYSNTLDGATYPAIGSNPSYQNVVDPLGGGDYLTLEEAFEVVPDGGSILVANDVTIPFDLTRTSSVTLTCLPGVKVLVGTHLVSFQGTWTDLANASFLGDATTFGAIFMEASTVNVNQLRGERIRFIVNSNVLVMAQSTVDCANGAGGSVILQASGMEVSLIDNIIGGSSLYGLQLPSSIDPTSLIKGSDFEGTLNSIHSSGALADVPIYDCTLTNEPVGITFKDGNYTNTLDGVIFPTLPSAPNPTINADGTGDYTTLTEALPNLVAGDVVDIYGDVGDGVEITLDIDDLTLNFTPGSSINVGAFGVIYVGANTTILGSGKILGAGSYVLYWYAGDLTIDGITMEHSGGGELMKWDGGAPVTVKITNLKTIGCSAILNLASGIVPNISAESRISGIVGVGSFIAAASWTNAPIFNCIYTGSNIGVSFEAGNTTNYAIP